MAKHPEASRLAIARNIPQFHYVAAHGRVFFASYEIGKRVNCRPHVDRSPGKNYSDDDE